MKQRLDDATLKEAGIKAEVDHLDGIVKQMKAEFDLQLMGGTMTKAAGPGLQIQRRIESMEDRLALLLRHYADARRETGAYKTMADDLKERVDTAKREFESLYSQKSNAAATGSGLHGGATILERGLAAHVRELHPLTNRGENDSRWPLSRAGKFNMMLNNVVHDKTDEPYNKDVMKLIKSVARSGRYAEYDRAQTVPEVMLINNEKSKQQAEGYVNTFWDPKQKQKKVEPAAAVLPVAEHVPEQPPAQLPLQALPQATIEDNNGGADNDGDAGASNTAAANPSGSGRKRKLKGRGHDEEIEAQKKLLEELQHKYEAIAASVVNLTSRVERHQLTVKNLKEAHSEMVGERDVRHMGGEAMWQLAELVGQIHQIDNDIQRMGAELDEDCRHLAEEKQRAEEVLKAVKDAGNTLRRLQDESDRAEQVYLAGGIDDPLVLLPQAMYEDDEDNEGGGGASNAAAASPSGPAGEPRGKGKNNITNGTRLRVRKGVQGRGRKLKGGARSTAAALLDVASHPTASIDELKGLFGHVAAIFSDINNLGGNLRLHGKAIYLLLIKYLPLAGAPGYTAATVLERVPVDKYIEVAASILDFFTGKGDLMHMLNAMADLVGNLFNQLKDLVPQILAKVGHEVSEAIGSSNAAASIANLFGANYEFPAVRQAREAATAEYAKEAAANEAKDKAAAERQTAIDTEKTAAEDTAKSAKEAQYVKSQKENLAQALTRLQFTPGEVEGYGTPQTDINKIAAVTQKDKQFIDAFLAKTGADLEKSGYPAPSGTPKAVVLDQPALDKLQGDAVTSHKNNDELWAMTQDPQLKAKAYAGDKAAQQLILKYYNKIMSPEGGNPTETGMQYLAGKGVRMAKEQMMSQETFNRVSADRKVLADGDELDEAEAAWLKEQESGYDPRDTAAGQYHFDASNPSGGSKPCGRGKPHTAILAPGTIHPFYSEHYGRHPFTIMKQRAAREGRVARLDTLDPHFFEGNMEGSRLTGSGKRDREEPTAQDIAEAESRADRHKRAASATQRFQSMEDKLNELSMQLFGKEAEQLDDDENERLDKAYQERYGFAAHSSDEDEEPQREIEEVIMGKKGSKKSRARAKKFMRKLKFPARVAQWKVAKAAELHAYNKMLRRRRAAPDYEVPSDQDDTEFEYDSGSSEDSEDEEGPPSRFNPSDYFGRR